jgi:hypothetical protein
MGVKKLKCKLNIFLIKKSSKCMSFAGIFIQHKMEEMVGHIAGHMAT